MEDSNSPEKGLKWWMRHVVVPIVVAAIALFAYFKQGEKSNTKPQITNTAVQPSGKNGPPQGSKVSQRSAGKNSPNVATGDGSSVTINNNDQSR